MAAFITSVAGGLGRFGKRLAMQAVISSIVMSGIGLVSRDDFALPRQVLAAAGVALPGGLFAPADEPAAAEIVPAAAPDGHVAADKAGRLGPVAEAPVPTPAPQRLAAEAGGEEQHEAAAETAPARHAATGPGDVLLFTQCAPACESRDPMLRAASAGLGYPPPPVVLAAWAPPPPPPPPPPPEETLLESAAALPGRALGGAAAGLGRFVGWGE